MTNLISSEDNKEKGTEGPDIPRIMDMEIPEIWEEKNKNAADTKSTKIYSNVEDILEALGGFGPYQLFILFILLVLEIPTAFVTFMPIFVGKVPKSWACSNDTSQTYSSSDICSVCTIGERVAVSRDADRSIVGEWGLICEKEWVYAFVTSIQMLGMFFGSVVGGQLTDWYGRRRGFLGSTLILLVGSALSGFAPDPYVYAVARFLCGAGVTSFMNVTLVGVVEVMPPRWRSLSNCIGPTGEGIMILSFMARYIRPWRTLYLSTSSPFLLIMIIYPFVPESPRWLLKKNKVDEAYQVFQLMARMNSRSCPDIAALYSIAENEKQSSTYRWSYLDFIKDKTLRITSLYNMAIWFAWSLTYYGISFNIRNVQGNVYHNVFYMGLANALGQRSALLINDRLGRRKALFTSMSFCAFFLVSLAVILMVLNHSQIPVEVVVSLCLLGQFGMASARSAARLLSGESFPTAVRTMGMGIGGITANLAGILTPQLAFIGTRWPSVPFFTFALVSVGGSLISFLMSETTGKPLDDSEEKPPEKNEEQMAKDNLTSFKNRRNDSLQSIFLNNNLNSSFKQKNVNMTFQHHQIKNNDAILVSVSTTSGGGKDNPCYE